MNIINGYYAISTSSGIQEFSSNENIKVYITLDLKSKSIKNNKAKLSVNIYFQHKTANVPINTSTQSGYIKLNNIQSNFTWNPTSYSTSVGSMKVIPAGTLVNIFSGMLEVDYGSNPSDLTFNVEFYANLNPSGAFRYVKGSGNMTISKITNCMEKIENIWKNVFSWVKILGQWKRAIVWKKINGVWKKGK